MTYRICLVLSSAPNNFQHRRFTVYKIHKRKKLVDARTSIITVRTLESLHAEADVVCHSDLSEITMENNDKGDSGIIISARLRVECCKCSSSRVECREWWKISNDPEDEGSMKPRLLARGTCLKYTVERALTTIKAARNHLIVLSRCTIDRRSFTVKASFATT